LEEKDEDAWGKVLQVAGMTVLEALITEKDYVNFLITLMVIEAGLRIREVPVSGKNESS